MELELNVCIPQRAWHTILHPVDIPNIHGRNGSRWAERQTGRHAELQVFVTLDMSTRMGITVIVSLTELPSCPPHFFSPSYSSLGSCSDQFDSFHFRSLSWDQNLQTYTIIHQQNWILIQHRRIWRGPSALTLLLASITAQVLNVETFKTLKAQTKPRSIKTESQRWDPELAVFKAPQVIPMVANIEMIVLE